MNGVAGPPPHDGGYLAGEMHLLAARKSLVRAVALAELGVLQDKLPVAGLPRFRADVQATFASLAMPPTADENGLAGTRRLLLRISQERQQKPSAVLGEASTAWNAIWSGRRVPPRPKPEPLLERLVGSARELAPAAARPEAELNRLIEQALRDQGLDVYAEFVQAVARGALVVLQAELPAADLPAFDSAVTAAFASLVRTPAAGDQLAKVRAQLRRISWKRRQEPDVVLNEAVAGWRAIWIGSQLPNHAKPEPLWLRLINNAPALARVPEAVLNRLIEQALRDQGGLDGAITQQDIRNWGKLQNYSLTVMPPTPNERHSDRCTLSHFREIGAVIPQNDHNTPRTVPTIYEMFWRFCSCCVGVRHPPIVDLASVQSPIGWVARHPAADEDPESDPSALDQAEAVTRVADEFHDELDEIVRKLLDEAKKLAPPHRQVVAIHLLVRLMKIEGVFQDVLSPPTVSHYPWLADTPLLDLDDAALAALLELDVAEVRAERQRTRHWLKATAGMLLARHVGASGRW